MIRCTLCLKFTILIFGFCSGLALITMKKALLWTNGWYFLQATKELSDQWNLTRIGEDPAVDVWMADVSHYVFKIFSKNKGYEQCKFPKRDLLFYNYASLVAFLEWITPPCLSTGIFYSDCYNLIRNFIWIFLLLLLSYIIIPIVQLKSEIGVQFYYTRVQSNYF